MAFTTSATVNACADILTRGRVRSVNVVALSSPYDAARVLAVSAGGGVPVEKINRSFPGFVRPLPNLPKVLRKQTLSVFEPVPVRLTEIRWMYTFLGCCEKKWVSTREDRPSIRLDNPPKGLM